MSIQDDISMTANLATARNTGRAAAALEGLERQAQTDRAQQQTVERLRQAVFEAGCIVQAGQAVVDRDPETGLFHARKAATCLVDGVDERQFPDLVDKHFLHQARTACEALAARARSRLSGDAIRDVDRLVWLESTRPLLREYAGWRGAHERLLAIPSAGRWVGAYVGCLLLGAVLQGVAGASSALDLVAKLVTFAAFAMAVLTAVRGRGARTRMQADLVALGERFGVQPSAGPGWRWDSGDTQRQSSRLAAALVRLGYDAGQGPPYRPAAEASRDLAQLDREADVLHARYPHLRL